MCLDLYTSKEKAAILSVQMGHKQQKKNVNIFICF